MKKLGLLLLVLILALGALGAGYAMWSDEVKIVGNVQTGSVCLQWSGKTISDSCIGTEGAPPPVITLNPPWEEPPFPGADPKYPVGLDSYWDKNVACTSIKYFVDESGKVDNKKLVITVTNAYPGYFADWQIEWKNCGTIPIRIQELLIEPDNFTRATTPDWQNPEADGQVWIDWVSDNIGDQLHPGDDDATSFKLLIMQTAEQGKTYTFTVTLKAVQWNEYQGP